MREKPNNAGVARGFERCEGIWAIAPSMACRKGWAVFCALPIAICLIRHEPIYAGKVILDDPGARIMNFVWQRLDQDTGSILAKSQWLQAYWNATVAVHGVFGFIEAGV